ncbi:MAG: hypothetical protein ACOCP8_09405 [archaeon]
MLKRSFEKNENFGRENEYTIKDKMIEKEKKLDDLMFELKKIKDILLKKKIGNVNFDSDNRYSNYSTERLHKIFDKKKMEYQKVEQELESLQYMI